MSFHQTEAAYIDDEDDSTKMIRESNVAQSGLEGRERASEREKGGRGETIKASGDTERVKRRATANISLQIKPSTSQEQHASIAISNHPQVKSNMPLSQREPLQQALDMQTGSEFDRRLAPGREHQAVIRPHEESCSTHSPQAIQLPSQLQHTRGAGGTDGAQLHTGGTGGSAAASPGSPLPHTPNFSIQHDQSIYSSTRALLLEKHTNFFDVHQVRNWNNEEFLEWFKDKVDLDRVEMDWKQGFSFLSGLKLSGESANKVAQKYLNALHGANLLLQKETLSYKIIMMADDVGPDLDTHHKDKTWDSKLKLAGEGSRDWKQIRKAFKQDQDVCEILDMYPHDTEGQMSRKILVKKFRTDPDLFLNFGPAGDLPIHLILLLGKHDLGIEILDALESSPQFWRRCEELIEQFGADRMPKLPPETKRDTEALRNFVINIPYQHDIVWWFREFKRREKLESKETGDSMTGAELVKHCKVDEWVPRNARDGILLDKAAGLFTGETLLHIAIQSRQKRLLEYLLQNGADLNAKATGNFFQPQLLCPLRDINHGTYYGDTPLCFAASLSDPDTLHTLCREAKKNIIKGITAGWRPDARRTIASAGSIRRWHHRPQIRFANTWDSSHDPNFLGQFWYPSGDEYSSRAAAAAPAPGTPTAAGAPATASAKYNEFLDQLAVQWYLICKETNEEDWNRDFVDHQRVGDEKDGYFRKGLSAEHLASDLLLAFVNTRDAFGNSALHLSVEHHNLNAITWHVVRDEKWDMSGLGRVSLTLLNWKNLTPFTLSVRAAQEDPLSLKTYRQILKDSYTETIWRYGDQDMCITSLYQMDTFRVHGKKLHDSEKYQSALQILVDFQVPVVGEMPEFAALIDEKWKKFARRHHIMFVLFPYFIFTAALSVSILLRVRSVRIVQQFVFEDDLERHEQEELLQLRYSLDVPIFHDGQLAADLIAYGFGVPWLLWNTWFTSRARSRYLDVNQDMDISYDEVTMYVFKNLNSWISLIVAILLVTAAAIRLSSQRDWFQVSIDTFQRGTWQNNRLSEELDVVSIAGLLTWIQILFQLTPFHGIGILLIKSWRMLVRGVFKWIFIQVIVICAFSLACHVLVYDFTSIDECDALVYDSPSVEKMTCAKGGNGDLRKSAKGALSLDDRLNSADEVVGLMLWTESIKSFVWTAMGEVLPNSQMQEARSMSLALTLHIMFVVVSTVVLMNLLIGMMSNTYAKDTNAGRQIWWFEYASLVLRYEEALSKAKKIYYRCGTFDRKHPAYDPKLKNSDVEYFCMSWTGRDKKKNRLEGKPAHRHRTAAQKQSKPTVEKHTHTNTTPLACKDFSILNENLSRILDFMSDNFVQLTHRLESEGVLTRGGTIPDVPSLAYPSLGHPSGVSAAVPAAESENAIFRRAFSGECRHSPSTFYFPRRSPTTFNKSQAPGRDDMTLLRSLQPNTSATEKRLYFDNEAGSLPAVKDAIYERKDSPDSDIRMPVPKEDLKTVRVNYIESFLDAQATSPGKFGARNKFANNQPLAVQTATDVLLDSVYPSTGLASVNSTSKQVSLAVKDEVTDLAAWDREVMVDRMVERESSTETFYVEVEGEWCRDL